MTFDGDAELQTGHAWPAADHSGSSSARLDSPAPPCAPRHQRAAVEGCERIGSWSTRSGAGTIVPAKVDAGSERGLREVADRLEAVLDLNPDLDLLGVALFAVDTSATRVQHEARNMIAESVGDPDVLFRATIRHSSAVAQAVRTRGLLVHELEDEVRAAPPWWKIRRGEATDGAGGPRTATSVADDFHALTMEIVERLSAGEQEEVSA
ncbi:hypothetical protein [Paraoerskovia sediminicola]|uniref:hypothetical protein n=1 Tax=Paraoerskovia sediminicola TaxID=1138587 RepID=UPI0025729C69|nr:hypothetical protein [Paraoerskovia sediminicola]